MLNKVKEKIYEKDLYLFKESESSELEYLGFSYTNKITGSIKNEFIMFYYSYDKYTVLNYTADFKKEDYTRLKFKRKLPNMTVEDICKNYLSENFLYSDDHKTTFKLIRNGDFNKTTNISIDLSWEKYMFFVNEENGRMGLIEENSKLTSIPKTNEILKYKNLENLDEMLISKRQYEILEDFLNTENKGRIFFAFMHQRINNYLKKYKHYFSGLYGELFYIHLINQLEEYKINNSVSSKIYKEISSIQDTLISNLQIENGNTILYLIDNLDPKSRLYNTLSMMELNVRSFIEEPMERVTNVYTNDSAYLKNNFKDIINKGESISYSELKNFINKDYREALLSPQLVAFNVNVIKNSIDTIKQDPLLVFKALNKLNNIGQFVFDPDIKYFRKIYNLKGRKDRTKDFENLEIQRLEEVFKKTKGIAFLKDYELANCHKKLLEDYALTMFELSKILLSYRNSTASLFVKNNKLYLCKSDKTYYYDNLLNQIKKKDKLSDRDLVNDSYEIFIILDRKKVFKDYSEVIFSLSPTIKKIIKDEEIELIELLNMYIDSNQIIKNLIEKHSQFEYIKEDLEILKENPL